MLDFCDRIYVSRGLILLSDASAIFVFNFNIFLRSTLVWISLFYTQEPITVFLMIYHLKVLHRFVDFFLDIQYLQPFPCVDICPCFLLILGSHLLFLNCLSYMGNVPLLNYLLTGLPVVIF